MKIGTPELKSKPATKYFEFGFIAFKTVNKELFFEIIVWSGDRNRATHSPLGSGPVKDMDHLKDLLAIKNVKRAVELVQ